MKPSAFDYTRPAVLPEALATLAARSDAVPIAGGQSLLVLLRLRLSATETLVDIARLPELAQTGLVPGGARFGATTTHAAVEDGLVPDISLGLMQRVASGIAYRAIRNLGTIGGSLALADPAADWPLCLLALDAVVLTAGPRNTRRIAMDDFLVSAFTTTLEPGDLITAIEVPSLPPGSRWGFVKLTRKHGAFADSLAAAVCPVGAPARVVLGATSQRAHLLTRTMALLTSDPSVPEAAMAACIAADVAEADPDADPYRRGCHEATVRKAVRQMRGQ